MSLTRQFRHEIALSQTLLDTIELWFRFQASFS
jgi:hypothetical protein